MNCSHEKCIRTLSMCIVAKAKTNKIVVLPQCRVLRVESNIDTAGKARRRHKILSSQMSYSNYMDLFKRHRFSFTFTHNHTHTHSSHATKGWRWPICQILNTICIMCTIFSSFWTMVEFIIGVFH